MSPPLQPLPRRCLRDAAPCTTPPPAIKEWSEKKEEKEADEREMKEEEQKYITRTNAGERELNRRKEGSKRKGCYEERKSKNKKT